MNKEFEDDLKKHLGKEVRLPEDSLIGIRIPMNTFGEGMMKFEIIANGKSYGKGTIPAGITGDFYIGAIKCPKSGKGFVFKPSLNFSLFGGSGISLGD